jgi:hypothetical protein
MTLDSMLQYRAYTVQHTVGSKNSRNEVRIIFFVSCKCSAYVGMYVCVCVCVCACVCMLSTCDYRVEVMTLSSVGITQSV